LAATELAAPSPKTSLSFLALQSGLTSIGLRVEPITELLVVNRKYDYYTINTQ